MKRIPRVKDDNLKRELPYITAGKNYLDPKEISSIGDLLQEGPVPTSRIPKDKMMMLDAPSLLNMQTWGLETEMVKPFTILADGLKRSGQSSAYHYYKDLTSTMKTCNKDIWSMTKFVEIQRFMHDYQLMMAAYLSTTIVHPSGDQIQAIYAAYDNLLYSMNAQFDSYINLANIKAAIVSGLGADFFYRSNMSTEDMAKCIDVYTRPFAILLANSVTSRLIGLLYDQLHLWYVDEKGYENINSEEYDTWLFTIKPPMETFREELIRLIQNITLKGIFSRCQNIDE